MVTAISLFSGDVDGLAIAAQAAGITVTHHVEWDSWCCRVLRMNHPDSVVINADIKTVKGLPYADVIMGGSPCQDFSVAGNRAGFSGERYLWPEMRRIIRECRPRVVIHENVRGGVSAGLLDRICTDLESDGYTAWPLVYPAAVFGAPHQRYRMFIVGLLADPKPHRRPEQGTISNTDFDQQQHLPAFERSRGTKFYAAESGGETMADSQHNGHIAPTVTRRDVEYNQAIRLETHDYESIGSNPGFAHIRFDGVGNYKGLSESGMGRTFNGVASGLYRLDAVRHFPGFPAGQGSYQHPYEPPRTTSKKGEYAKERIQALGNAVVWQQAAPIMRTVMRWLEGQG